MKVSQINLSIISSEPPLQYRNVISVSTTHRSYNKESIQTIETQKNTLSKRNNKTFIHKNR